MIAVAPRRGLDPALYALRDDGAVFAFENGKWNELLPVPDTERANWIMLGGNG